MDNNLLIANIKTKTFLHALGLLTINESFFKFIIIFFYWKILWIIECFTIFTSFIKKKNDSF